MNTPSATDLRRLLDLVHDLDGDAADQLGRMGAILGSDMTSLSTVDHVEGRLVASRSTPAESNLIRVSSFHSVFTLHPGFAAFRAGRLRPGTPAAWSDVNTLRELRRNPLYADFFAPRGTRDQLLCVVRLNRREGHLLSFNRSRRGWTGRDRTVVQLISAHLGRHLARRAEITRLRRALHRREGLDAAAGRLAALTPREREVLGEVARGASDRDIARSLGVRERTVHKHLEQAYRKLGVHSRTQAAALLHG
ncbi:LuxR C-terminal-related transcriptional regulator [Actinoplanes oblitus]|uniref:LuxR C-terminal-related transcriptional regulator n=1 Tax=Actinoplanes oblitus TaxID=3040509 RepID=A0ABY8WSS0_9ACTN|nr:LuxR C-terminal-related transcriptional regulator [Actinoplanes oblitus]WIM99905.1 LuxR C-terminal-related transcriptional regulator [Actinoplanes oblitus]